MNKRELFLQHVAQTSDFPLSLDIQKAEGIKMYSKDKEYIDLISGIGVSNIGHRHPNVIKAIQGQLDKYLHLMVYGEFIQTPQVELAKAISDTLSENLNNVFFVNSGSEAVEGALKLAKRHTGRGKIISCKESYHGSSQGALSLSSDEEYKRKFQPLLPNIKHIEFNNSEDLKLIDKDTAAVIIEPIQGEAGINIPNKEYIQALVKKCKTEGALVIFDEIQTGFGRTGKFWAHEHFEVSPDILLCAKGMGGGMPIGAFISSEEIMGKLKSDPILGHISTFGGHPVCCAASLATLKTIQEENLLFDVEEKGKLFLSLLDHPAIIEKRQLGLFIAIEFESFDLLKAIIDKSIENGVLTDWFLFNDRSMRIAPPLTITKEEIKEACKKVMEAINASI